MTDPKCARMVLRLAAGDARALKVMRDPDEVTEEVFGFHLQQAVEKAFKGWIAVLGGLYELTHDLDELLQQLDDCGAHPGDLDRFRALARFTPYAVGYRYEGVAEWVEPIDRNAAIALVAELLEHVGAALDAVEQ
ncbi:MAG: HEPN domain-containing protein [Acidobacteria bacterium]|nr:HEPN domain-containing protein [Acidobacteriota bacterium]